jgi:hypothetical protein
MKDKDLDNLVLQEMRNRYEVKSNRLFKRGFRDELSYKARKFA